jgi:phosphonate transport system ATP-binding protein
VQSLAPNPIAAAGVEPAVIRVTGLIKAFEAGKPVLDGVDLAIDKGSLVALIGANGTGKSTLLRCISRLIAADAGAITVLGERVESLGGSKLRALRTRVGFVFQKHNLVGRLAVLTNVIHGAQARGFGPRAWCQGLAPRALRQEALDCLDRVGLADFAGRRTDSLSGGQSQRVAIARALMQRPEIVLADEPAASLDPQAGDEIMRLLFSLMRENRVTIVFSSHHLRHAMDYADRIVGLSNGRIAVDAPTNSLSEPGLRRLYA